MVNLGEEHGRWEWHVDRAQLSTQLRRRIGQQLARVRGRFGSPGRRFPGRADHSADRSPHSAGRLSPRLGVGFGVNVITPTGSGPGIPSLQSMSSATVREASTQVAIRPSRRRVPSPTDGSRSADRVGSTRLRTGGRPTGAPQHDAASGRDHVPSCTSKGRTSFRTVRCAPTDSVRLPGHRTGKKYRGALITTTGGPTGK